MNIKPFAKTSEILVQELEKELLVYDLQTNKAFCLNETSAIVFQLCDDKRTVIEIADAMSGNLTKLVSEDFVRLALNELKKDNLLENSDELKDFFAGMSRRKMVKKVGLDSMIALPLITSVTAPSAVNAQSCTQSGAFCLPTANSQGDCCSGLRCSFTAVKDFRCTNCVAAGSILSICSLIGGCGNCNNNVSLCCNSSTPTTNDETNCYCG